MTRPGALPTTSVLAVAILLAACGEPEPPQERTDPRLIIDETAYFDNRLNGLWHYELGSGTWNDSSDLALYATPSRSGTEIVMFVPNSEGDEDSDGGIMFSFRLQPLTAGNVVYARLNYLAVAPANWTLNSIDEFNEVLGDDVIRYRLTGDGTLEIWGLDTEDLQEIFNPIETCGDAAVDVGGTWEELPIDALASREECWPEDDSEYEFVGRFVRDGREG